MNVAFSSLVSEDGTIRMIVDVNEARADYHARSIDNLVAAFWPIRINLTDLPLLHVDVCLEPWTPSTIYHVAILYD